MRVPEYRSYTAPILLAANHIMRIMCRRVILLNRARSNQLIYDRELVPLDLFPVVFCL